MRKYKRDFYRTRLIVVLLQNLSRSLEEETQDELKGYCFEEFSGHPHPMFRENSQPFRPKD